MSRTRVRALAAAIALGALGACDTVAGPPGNAELERARERWRAARPAEYAYTLTRECFCGPDVRRPVTITVRGSGVVDRRYADTGAPVDPRHEALFPSIDGLFAIIDDARARRADRMDLVFDPTLGHPVRIDIDYSTRAIDEEVTLTVSSIRTP
jgi:hypothetical protein